MLMGRTDYIHFYFQFVQKILISSYEASSGLWVSWSVNKFFLRGYYIIYFYSVVWSAALSV